MPLDNAKTTVNQMLSLLCLRAYVSRDIHFYIFCYSTYSMHKHMHTHSCIAYRFFPLLVLLNVVVVCVGGRDFGPMLSVERQSGFPLEIEEQESSEVELHSPNGNSEDNEGFTGEFTQWPLGRQRGFQRLLL